MKKIILIILLCSLSISSQAKLQRPPLQSYHAKYNVYSYGFQLGEAERSFQTLNNNRYEIRNHSESDFFFVDLEIHESSQGIWHDGRLRPNEYQYHFRNKNKRRDREWQFDWTKQRIVDKVKNKTWPVKLKPDTQDKLSYTTELRLDFCQNKKRFDYQVADDGEINLYHFEHLGYQEVETDLGYIYTHVFRHQSDNGNHQTIFWLAPSLDCIMVKLEQIDRGKKVAVLKIKSLQLANKQITQHQQKV